MSPRVPVARPLGRAVLAVLAVLAAVVTLLGVTAAATPAGAAPAVAAPTWSAPVAVTTPRGGLDALSCPTATFCMAVDLRGNAVSWNGSRWSAPTQVVQGTNLQYGMTRSDTIGLISLACASPTSCLAVDTVYGSWRFDGSTWRALPAGSLDLLAASGSGGSYLSVAVDGRTSVSDGTSWRTAPPAGGDVDPDPGTPGVTVVSLTCGSATFCIAQDGFSSQYYVWDGSGWTTRAGTAHGPFRTLSCAGRWCLTGTGAGEFGVFDGRTWQAAPSGPSGGLLACAGPTRCVSATTSSVAEWNGTLWTRPQPQDSGSISAVACARSGLCGFVDEAGSAWTGTGRGWTRAVVDPYVGGQAAAVSCPTTTACVLVDSGREILTWDGRRWHDASGTRSQGRPWADVSCSDAAFCMVTGADGTSQVVVDGHPADDPIPSVTDEYSPLTDVTCASSTLCFAIGWSPQIPGTSLFRWDGSRWTVDTRPVDRPYGVACAPHGTCVMIGDGRSQVFDGTRWTRPVPMPPWAGSVRLGVEVSCGSSSFCGVVASDGEAMTWNGSSWSAPALAVPSDSDDLFGPRISCVPGRRQCTIVNGQGRSSRLVAGAWTTPVTADPLPGHEDRVTGVSCPSSTLCLATDTNGDVVYRRG